MEVVQEQEEQEQQQQQQQPQISSHLEKQLVDILLEEKCSQLNWSLESKSVLVVGCGTGEITALELLPRLPPDVTVVAIDQRGDMLELASARFANPRLCFIQMDIAADDIEESPAWALGPYSKVFSFFYLQSIRDQNLMLQNIYKLLSPGGEALLVLVIHTAVDALYQALARSSLWELYVEDYRHFVTPYQFLDDPKEVLKSYLEEAGFLVRISDSRETFLITGSFDVVKDGVRATNLPHERLPQELRDLYLEECIAEVKSNGKLQLAFPPTEGVYYYRYTALVALAMKRVSCIVAPSSRRTSGMASTSE